MLSQRLLCVLWFGFLKYVSFIRCMLHYNSCTLWYTTLRKSFVVQLCLSSDLLMVMWGCMLYSPCISSWSVMCFRIILGNMEVPPCLRPCLFPPSSSWCCLPSFLSFYVLLIWSIVDTRISLELPWCFLFLSVYLPLCHKCFASV